MAQAMSLLLGAAGLLRSSAFTVTGSAMLSLWLLRKRLVLAIADAIARTGPRGGKVYLSGAYAPVAEEVHKSGLDVIQGELPAELQGAYVRTGPNPYLTPVGGYHWFDGDGMLHGVRFKDGKASYANHFVRTNRLLQEKAAGRPLFGKMGDSEGKRGLLLILLDSLKLRMDVYNKAEGGGTANTALVYHAQRLLALHEGDMPYQVRMLCDGLLETVGRLRVGGPGSSSPEQDAFPGPFTAHPKVDTATGEMYFLGYSLNKAPYLRMGMLDAKGHLAKQWVVDLPWGCMMHDMGLTANHMVILHLPLVFDPQAMIKNGSLPLAFNDKLPARLGLLRRDEPGCEGSVMAPGAKPAQVQWFELPPFYVFHLANCWEDSNGCVHIVACSFPRFAFHSESEVDKSAPPEEERQRLVEYVLDPATGKHVSTTQLSEVKCDFPVVHPKLTGRPTRYVWGATFNYHHMHVEATGIAKYDLSKTASGGEVCVGQITYGPGCFGGEAVFIPREQSAGTEVKQGTEDDGWLLVFVHDNNTDKSSMNVYDARTMDNTPLAKLAMPQRVPYGFHGTFVTEQQLLHQSATRV